MQNLIATGVILGALTAGSAQAGDATSAGKLPVERYGVMCVVWAAQMIADHVFDDGSTAQDSNVETYPVPAPVWVLQSVNSLYTNQGS